VLVLRSPGVPAASRAFVVEVQLHTDVRKRWSWPLYVIVLRARLRCPVSLVVVTLDESTARWCATPIPIDENGSLLRPCVIGPALVPIVGEEQARRHPELGLLSVLAHCSEPIAFELARGFLLALADVDDARARWYADVVLSRVDEAIRRALEAEMNLEKYELRSEYLRRLKAEGLAEGEARGQLVALGHAVLKVLEARGIAVADEQRAIVAACIDRELLDEWLVRAVRVADADELFAG
jgi:hypothetical protein